LIDALFSSCLSRGTIAAITADEARFRRWSA